MAAQRIVQLKESGIECSIDQRTVKNPGPKDQVFQGKVNIRIGTSKGKSSKPDYGNFSFELRKKDLKQGVIHNRW